MGADSLYNDYFGPECYEALEQTAGWQDAQASYTAWREGDNENHYDLFTAGGLDLIAVHLGYDVTAEELDWASEVLDQYSDRNAMVMTHAHRAPSNNPDDMMRFGASFFRMLQIDVEASEMAVDTYSPLLDDFGATEYDERSRYNGTEDDTRLPIQLETRQT